MPEAIGMACDAHYPAEKCLVPASDPYVVSQPFSEGAHFRDRCGGEKRASELILFRTAGHHRIAGEGHGSTGPIPCAQGAQESREHTVVSHDSETISVFSRLGRLNGR